MKKIIPLFLLLVLGHQSLLAQSQYFSENRIFDQVKDRFGNNYQLADITIRTSNNLTNSAPSNSCVAGYFTLYFVPGSALDFSPGQTNIICEVFRNISELIVSNIPAGSINIRCDNLPANSTALGVASSYYVYPLAPANVNQGIIYSQVQKALLTGIDSYSNLPISNFLGGGNYHGRLDIANIANWNLNLNSTNIAVNDYDLYSVVLHEVGHLIGVNSLLSSSGTSLLGSNYYSKFDQYLFDSNANPLLVPSSTLCPTSSLAFAASTLALAPGTCPSTQTNVTTCTAAVQYISPNLNLKVYTPECFEAGSSLSHFEDMCSTITFTPSGPGASCSPTPAIPGFNDQYFSICNANFPGPCYVKRYLKQEEKCVLSDLGYSTNTTYTSVAVLSGTSQTASYSLNCPPALQIVGLNDGLQNGNYTFTSSTTDYVLLPGQLLSNDVSPSALQVSCLELIYSNATITPGATDYTITAPPGIGLILLKYYPTDGNGNFGNVAYVYVYFTPPGCNSVANCNLIQNGGFESNQSTTNINCGAWGGANAITMNCWAPYNTATAPLLFGTSCSAFSGNFLNLGINTINTVPPVGAINFSPVPNNNCVSIRGPSVSSSCNAIKNNLASNLIPGQSYELSLWAINATASPLNPSLNTNNSPIAVTVASHSVFAFTPTVNFPSGLNSLLQFTINPLSTWSHLTYTFVYNAPSSVQASALIIGIDQVNTVFPPSGFVELFLDEISLTPLSTPLFSPPTTSVCGSNSILDLGQFTSFGSGVFSGPGVTQNGLQYDFNSAQTLGAGNYVIAYSYTNTNCSGVKYQQVTLPLVTNCCSNTLIPAYTQSAITGPQHIWLGPMRITNDITIPSGTEVQILGEVAMSPSVQITVSNNATLTLMGAHLFACGLQMWKGIVVQNGGQLRTQFNANSCLIEDAITAIDVSNHTSASGQYILNIENTIFNKNKCSINITNYQATTSGNYPFLIRSSVFTCRELPFSTFNWPSANNTSQGSGISAQLRYASSGSTLGLGAPYIGNLNFQVCNLKEPFNNQPSEVAIALSNVGMTQGSSFYGSTIGDDANAADFNLFDACGSFIYALNSNIALRNNVFQNTVRYPAQAPFTGSIGGIAVHSDNQLMNSKLDLTSSNFNVGNRFWDCHTGIHGTNLFRLHLEKVTMRSAQTNTVTGIQPGRNGLILGTNRFQYFLKDNEFTNLSYPINIPISSGTYTTISTGTQTGIYADRIVILNNLFASGSNSLQSINTGINISCPNQVPFDIANDYNIVPYTKAIVVEQNTMTAVERGVAINGITGFQTTIERNTISLRSASSSQHAIDLSNCFSAGNAVGQFMVITNTLAGADPSANLETLVYSGFNSGVYSPSITCNSLSNSYQGFVFQGSSPLTVWAGNRMQPLARGLVLGGIIGPQGSNATASNNEWRGSWTPNANYGTYVVSGTFAWASLLWVKGGTNSPPNNDGSTQPSNQYGASNTLSVALGGDYQCGNGPNNRYFPLPDQENFETSGDLYSARSAAYRLLYYNDSVFGSNPLYEQFINNQADLPISVLMALQEKLYDNDNEGATLILNQADLLADNYYLQQTVQFYRIYVDYLNLPPNIGLNAEDSLALITMASDCPSSHGSVVFQARALYNTIYKIILNTDNCAGSYSRNSLKGTLSQKIVDTKNLSNIRLTPNPSNGNVLVTSQKENEKLRYEIKNPCGQVLKTGSLQCQDSTYSLNIELTNGLYYIVFQKSDGAYEIHKMVIQR